MRRSASFITPSGVGRRAVAAAVALMLAAGVGTGASLIGVASPAAAALSPETATTEAATPTESSATSTTTDAATTAATPAPTASETPAPAPTASASPSPSAPATKKAVSRLATTSAATSSDSVSIMSAAVGDPVVWREDFGTGNGNAQQISAYGAYAADAYWNDGAYCNGVILSFNTTIAQRTSACNTWAVNNVRALADVLGQVAAGTTSTASTKNNRAVVEWTEGGPTTTRGNRVLSTTGNLGVAGDRYYVPSIDVAETSCGANNSSITVGLQYGSFTPAQTATSAAVATCTTGTAYTGTSPTNSDTYAIRAQSIRSANALMLPAANASSLRLFVNNATTADNGNDFAIDTPRIIDVTPSLAKAFTPATIMAGDTSTLTFTLTNTSEAAAKNDMRFTDTLPTGLVVAGTPAIGGTCTSTTGAALTRTATAGSSSIAVAGVDFAAGAASCTVTVAVTAAAAGSYVNGAANITNENVVDPADVTLTVTELARLTIRKNLTAARVNGGDQFTLSVRSSSGTTLTSATTTGSATGIQAAQVTDYPVRPGTTYTVAETVSTTASLNTYDTSYSCVRGETVIATGTEQSGALTIPDEPGAQIVCTFTNVPQASAKLYCDASYVYAIRADGTIVQGNASTGAVNTLPGTPSGITTANSLAIAFGGTTAFAVARSGTDAGGVASVIKYSVANGTMTSSTQVPTVQPGQTGTIVAGAVDAKGNYIIGKSDGTVFRLYRYNETTASFVSIGSVATGTATTLRNGDFAFDRQGNLFILQSLGGSQQTYAVTAAAYDAAVTAASSDTVIPATATANKASDISGLVANGIAYSSRGVAYLSSATTVYQFDPMTWTTIAGAQTLTIATGSGNNSATDLASCAAPSTISLDKQVVGRRAGGAQDNFTISLAAGGATVATAATGAGTGSRTASIAPLPVLVNSQVTISETMLNATQTPTDVSANYSPIYECWADGVRIFNGTATSATITIPNRAGVGVACTYFNTPQPIASVTITKKVQDAAGANETVAAGWTVGMTATTTSTVGGNNNNSTALPYNTPTQTTGSDGTASWTVLFGTANVRASLALSEVQRSDYEIVSFTCTISRSGATVDPVTATATNLTVTDVQAGDNVQCTIVNKVKETRITLLNVVNGSRPATAWTLSATGPSGALAGPSGTTGVTGLVSPATAYTLAQSTSPATYVNSGYSCVDQTGATVAVSASSAVTLPLGTRAVCTITNSTAQITLLKNVVSPDANFQAPMWTVIATPGAYSGAGTLQTETRVGAEYSASGNASQTFDVRPGHTYTLSERATDSTGKLSWNQLRLERLQANGTWTTVSGSTITAPTGGQSATYRFVNERVVSPALPLTGGTSTDMYLMVGASIVLLALLLGAWQLRRRSRKTLA